MKDFISIKYFLLTFLILLGCEDLNSPNDYMMIPGKITITGGYKVDDNNYYIYFSWPVYEQQHSGLEYTRNSKTIANLSKGSTLYTDTLHNLGTFEYRLYAVEDSVLSLPSYIGVRIKSDGYDFWYD